MTKQKAWMWTGMAFLGGSVAGAWMFIGVAMWAG